MDEHYLSFGTVFLAIVSLGIFAVGGTILFLTFRHWRLEKLKQSAKEHE